MSAGLTPGPPDIETLISALFDDPDFALVHEKISPLNLFEALGATRAELRHSNFLAYLMSPSRPHGLGARPLVAVLRAVLSRMPSAARPVMTLELIAGELDDAIVYRERGNIDVLVALPSLKLAVAIENKVDAKAGDGQLERYSQYLKREFPGFRYLLIFLTPEGIDPEHDDYVAYDYADLAATLEGLLGSSETVPPETGLLIKHYVEMVRRHIVHDDKLHVLAQTLYERHKEAFDFIFECRPEPLNLLLTVRQITQSLPGLVEDSSGANSFRFVPTVWDDQLKVIKGDPTKWSRTGRGIMFECKTYPQYPGRVNISVILGPGDQKMRALVYERAMARSDVFVGLVKPMGQQWVTIFSRDLLTTAQAHGITFEAQANNVGLAWSDFQGTQLPALTEAVLAIDAALAAVET